MSEICTTEDTHLEDTYLRLSSIYIYETCISQACISRACISQACISWACISQACVLVTYGRMFYALKLLQATIAFQSCVPNTFCIIPSVPTEVISTNCYCYWLLY